MKTGSTPSVVPATPRPPNRLLRPKKKGVRRFDLRDSCDLAIPLTWPQFLAALLALHLSVNGVSATLYWLVAGSVANTRPN